MTSKRARSTTTRDKKNGAVGTTSAQRPAGRAQHAHTLATRHDLYGLVDEPRAEGVVGGRDPVAKSATVACDPKTHGRTAVSGERDSGWIRAHLPTSAHMLAHIVFMWAPTFGSALASVSG